MSGFDRPSEGNTMLSATLLSVAIILAVLALVVALTQGHGHLRAMAGALAVAGLVHLCAVWALGWTRRPR